MVDPVSIGISLLVGSAPHWFPALRATLWAKGKELASEKGKSYIQTLLDEKKHQRNIELALQNAAERGLRQWQTSEDRDRYRSILEILSNARSDGLRQEAMQLFALHDTPDLAELSARYNLSRRITDLAHHTAHVKVDATPYLRSFFEGLFVALYEDPLFRGQISAVIADRAALQIPRTLTDILNTLNSIDSHLSTDYSPQRFQKDVDVYLKHIERCYQRHKFAGIVFKGDEDQAPELESIFVPLRTELQARASDRSTEKLTVWLNRSPYVVLLGGPGAGKSTSTRYLAWSHARANLTTANTTSRQPEELLAGNPVPLRIELRLLSNIRKRHPGYSFLTFVTEVMLGQEEVAISPQMFQELLKRRALFVLFDGLDEVAALSERKQLVEEIENFAGHYPGNYILVTSRPIGYELASITNPLFQHATILDFSDEQIHQFLENWYTYVLKYSPLPASIRQELEAFYATLIHNEHLHKLAVNPLLLTVMTALHRYERLPDKRVLIYEKCADLLLDTWARLKYEEGTRWKDMKLGKQDQLNCIAHLGYVLHQRSQENDTQEGGANKTGNTDVADTAVDVPASFIRRVIQQFLTEQDLLSGAERNAEAERFLELVQREAGLIVSRGTDETGEELYGFVHRTFQEYFAAVHLLNLFQQGDATIIPSFLKKYVHDPHWHEVILLLFGKLQHRYATTLLRHILTEGTERSRYADVLQQDLFFVCDCLIDGISIEENFAKEIVIQLQKIIEETPFPEHRLQALAGLVALRQTQRYADLSRPALQKYITTNDLSLQLQVAKVIYQFSPVGSDKQCEGARLLIARYKQGNLSLEQQLRVAEAIYQFSPLRSDEEREGARLLLALYQRDDLSLQQQLQVAETIYRFSPSGSEEQHESVRLLTALFQQDNLSLQQQLQVAETIYRFSPSGSEEERESTRLLLACYQQGHFSLREHLQIAQSIYHYSPEGSDERYEGARLLIARYQQNDLSLEQQLQIAQTIYYSSPSGSEEKREGARLLIARYQQNDLSLEQQLQIAQTIYQFSPLGSEEKHKGARLLTALFQHEDLSLEQQIQIAQIIYHYSSGGSSEQREGTYLFTTLLEQGNLSLEQQLQIAQTIYRYSPERSNERREGARLLTAHYYQGYISLEQQIQVAQVIYQLSSRGSNEKREGARLLTALFQRGNLSLEQQLQVARAIYRYSPLGSNERREGFGILCRYMRTTDVPRKQQLQLFMLPCSLRLDNFSERARAIQLILALHPSEIIGDLLEKNWVSPPLINETGSRYNEFVTEIPAIYELAQQEVLPVRIRDEMYQLLLRMVPLFDQLD